jgi:HEPN domain-containing protein
MNGDESATTPESRREARRWLLIVEEDLDVANAAVQLPRPRHGAAAYHLQQAAEKLIKSLLILNGVPFRRVHDLDELVTRLLPICPQFAETLESLRALTVWGVAYRYPSLEDEPDPPPTTEELGRYAMLLATFATEVASLIGQD